MAAAENEISFEDDPTYERYPALQERIEQIVFADRGSAMRVESVRRINDWKNKDCNQG